MRRLFLLSCALSWSLAELPAQSPASDSTGAETATLAATSTVSDSQPKLAVEQAPAAAKVSYSSCTVEGQFVALTFDDGPHAQNTPRLLDMLKERGAKATFFVVGQNALQYPEILKRIVAEGHELASHSYTHPVLNSLGQNGIREELEKTHQAVLHATGVTMKLLRPPYGALSENMRRWANATFGYKIILWDVDPLDWKVRDAARVQSEILGHARAGSIVLAHDIHKTTVDAMPQTLDGLVSKGFKFVTVSELLAMDRPGAPKPAAAPAAKPAAKKDAKPDGDRKGAPEKTTVAKASTSVSSAGEASKKTAQLSQEELRKKWLELNKR